MIFIISQGAVVLSCMMEGEEAEERRTVKTESTRRSLPPFLCLDPAPIANLNSSEVTATLKQLNASRNRTAKHGFPSRRGRSC
jgi:hypothetical protein